MVKKMNLFSLLLIGSVIAIALLLAGNYVSQFLFGNSPNSVEIDAEPVKNIKIVSGSTSVQLLPAEGNQLQADLKQRQLLGQYKLNVDTSKDEVKIEVVRKGIGWNLFGLFSSDLTVQLPKKVWDSLQVTSGSGRIMANEITAEEAEMNVGSGKVVINDLQLDDLKLKSGSGKIEMKEITADQAVVHVGSGKLSVEHYSIDDFAFTTGSGKVDLENGEGALNGKSGSGKITLDIEQILHPISLEAGSGKLHINTEQILADLDLKVGSGKIEINAAELDGLNVDYRGHSNRADLASPFHYTTEDRNRVSGYFGSSGSGATVKARTGSGSFTVTSR